MRSFTYGTVFGIVIATVGFSGVANLLDQGVLFIKNNVSSMASKQQPFTLEQPTQHRN
jgi:hypothetical protein